MTKITKKNIKAKVVSSDFVASFIQKSYQLLDDKKSTDIVDWNAEGTAIVIKKPQEFAQKVLPTYFKHNNLTSFVRQLNMYDFRKRRTKVYDHVYYHDLFKRDEKHLLKDIKRKNQEPSIAYIQKAIEALKDIDSNQNSEQGDQATDLYEGQLLKKLNKDLFNKIESLENKMKELTAQNEQLQSQVILQTKKEDILVSFMSESMRKNGVRLDQLSDVLSGQLQLSGVSQVKTENIDNPQERVPFQEQKGVILRNIGDLMNFNEISSVSTELPSNSPQSKTPLDFHRVSSEGVDSEFEGWIGGPTEPNRYRSQLNKRIFGMSDDDEEFEDFGKMIKVEGSSNELDFINLYNINNNGEAWDIKQEEHIDLMNFN